MIHISEYRGVFFVEGALPEARLLGEVSTELSGMFAHNQLRSLDDVKAKLCEHVRAKGGNCLTEFRYGQRSTFWKSIFAMDDVVWYASGKIASISEADLRKHTIVARG